MAIEEQTTTQFGREEALANTILLGEVGSTVHGVGTGSDDRDEMGVCIEPPEYVLGLRHFEQVVYRTQPEGARSGPGDLDQTIYGLRKYASLALKGNPSVLLLLFTPEESLVPSSSMELNRLGRRLRALAPAFASKKAGYAYLGYMRRQRERLEGTRGQRNVKRPELIERYGYDTKFAAHMLRLGYQGLDYMRTGRIPVPMPEPQRDLILAIRGGRHTEAEALQLGFALEGKLALEVEKSDLPRLPDYEAVNEALVGMYADWWGCL